MGFSFHITTIFAGADFDMHYQNHLESVYCISGEGQITERDSGTTHLIQPGTVYALDQNDRHTLKAISEMQLACVFNPPITGKEVHNAEGAYELVE
jgi:L-ectoine synthase